MHKASLVQMPLCERETSAPAATTEALGTLPRTGALPGVNPASPSIPRWKMLVITLIPAYIGSTIFGLALFALFPDWPFTAINLLMNVFLVLLLTYVTQPLAQRLLAGWLYAPSPLSQKLAARWRRIVLEIGILLVLIFSTLRRISARLPASRLLVCCQAQKLIALARLTWAPGGRFRATIQIRVTVHKGGHSCTY